MFIVTQWLQWLHYQAAFGFVRKSNTEKNNTSKNRQRANTRTPRPTVIKPLVPIIRFSQRKPRLREGLTGPELYSHYIVTLLEHYSLN